MGSTPLSSRVAGMPAADTERRKTQSFLSMTLRHLRHDRLTLGAIAFLVLVAVLAVFADVLSRLLVGVGPNDTNLAATVQPPYLWPYVEWRLGLDNLTAARLLGISDSVTHWLGTDGLGRDQLVRLLYGARISMLIALCATLIAFLLGCSLGMVAGYFGGWTDDVISWVINTFSSIPTLFVLILVTSIYRPNAFLLTLFLGFFGWIALARFMRGQVLQTRALDYTLAARALGASHLRIMWQHILPNTIPLIIVLATVDIGALVLVESVLSFLGLGVQPPQATWGSMLAKSQDYLFRQDPVTGAYSAWHLIFPPGILIFLTVLSLYLLGDGLRDAMDPQLRTGAGTRGS